MPVALSIFLPLLFGVGVWHFRGRKSQRITVDGLIECTVQALGLCAVLLGVASIALMLVASWFRPF
ncbi:MAG TPA: hypothetical protein VF280_14765 [Burkholderiales bacterium]|jgi:hypothetical protein